MKEPKSSLAEQLQQLRVLPQLKESPCSDLDSHIKEVIHSNLSSVPPKALLEPDLLNASSLTLFVAKAQLIGLGSLTKPRYPPVPCRAQRANQRGIYQVLQTSQSKYNSFEARKPARTACELHRAAIRQ